MDPLHKIIDGVLKQYQSRAIDELYNSARIDIDLIAWAGATARQNWIKINWSFEWESDTELRFTFTAGDDNNSYFVLMEFDHLSSTSVKSVDDAYERAMKGI